MFLLGLLEKKDYKGITQELKGFASRVFLTIPLNPKAILPQIISPYLAGEGIEVEIVKDLFQARDLAFQFAQEEKLPLVVAGSFYLAPLFAHQLLLPQEEEENYVNSSRKN